MTSRGGNEPVYLSNAEYLDAATCESRVGTICVESGVGGGIEFVDAVPAGAEAIDCSSRFVTRGFVVGHHHMYSALARGMPGPAVAPTSFVEILEKIWWKLDKALDPDMIRASARVAAIDAALSGTTMIIDHHASPNAWAGSLGIIAEAVEEVGLSHLLCVELSDRDGVSKAEQALAETERHLGEHQGLVGLHASFTVSDELLGRAVGMARDLGTGVHIHVAEAESDQEHCLANYSKRCVHRLAEAGALDLPRTILAHCIHLDDSEQRVIAASRAWVAQQAESNENNAVGTLDGRAFEDRIIIGTDGMHGDCLAAARASYLASQAVGGLSPGNSYLRLRRVHEYLSQNGFAGDSGNNLVVLDYAPPTPVTADNWPGHVAYGLNRSHVETVISDGRVVVRDRRCIMVDEHEVMADARRQSVRLWDRL